MATIERVRATKKSCFVCDTSIVGKYHPLASYKLQHSKKEIFEKLGTLIGDKYVVICHSADVICQRCVTVLETLDKLEKEAAAAKGVLLRFLDKKYSLDREGDEMESSPVETQLVEEPLSAFALKKRRAQEAVEQLTEEVNDDPRSRIRMKCDTCQYTTNYTSFVQRHIRPKNCPLCNSPFSDGVCSARCTERRVPAPKESDVPGDSSSLLANNILEEGNVVMLNAEEDYPLEGQISLVEEEEREGFQDKKIYLQVLQGNKEGEAVHEVFTVANSGDIENMNVMWDDETDRTSVLMQGATIMGTADEED